MGLTANGIGLGAPGAPTARMRVRPGDRPGWLNVSTAHLAWEVWRGAAATRGVALDALIAILLEHHIAVRDLRAIGFADPAALLSETATDDLRTTRLAPTAELRYWVRLLSGRERDDSPLDELPELALPQRLLHQRRPNENLEDVVTVASAETAFRCECAAAVRGLTLQAWALHTALSEAVSSASSSLQ